MSATQPLGVDSTSASSDAAASSEAAVRSQLDLLSKGEIDHLTFLDNMKERFRFLPDENWEVLSLVDQYYRRGKINQEIFRALKSGFAEYILGPQSVAAGQRRRTPPTLHTVDMSAANLPDGAAAPPNAMAGNVAPAPAIAAASPAAMPAAAAVAAAPVAAPAPAVVAAAPVAAPTAVPASTPVLTTALAGAPERWESVDLDVDLDLDLDLDEEPIDSVPSLTPSADRGRASAQAAPSRDIEVGDFLRNRYRIDALIAKGVYGTVFEANDTFRLNLPPAGKRIAIKVLRWPDPRHTFIKQIRQEFHQLQLLSHPNIVRAFDFDRDGALAFFTMELLNGEHLNRVLLSRGTALQRPHALAIIRDIGGAIAYAHSQGIAHGGINPHNIYITTRGEVRVLGFGVSNEPAGITTVPNFEQASPPADNYSYASCEVLQGGRPEPSDDVYSLSCLAYLLLTGKHPFADSTSVEARAERSRPTRHSGLSHRQWLTLRAGLQTDARKRPSDVQAWLQGLELEGAAKQLPPANELANPPARQPRRLQWAIAGALIAALLGGGFWLYANRGMFGSQPVAQPTARGVSVAPAGDTLGAAAPAAAVPAAAVPAAAVPAAAAPAAAAPAAGTPVAQPPAATMTPADGPVAGGAAPGAPAAQPPAARLAPASATNAKSATLAAAPAAAVPVAPAPAPAAHPAPAATKVEMAVDTLDASPTDTVVHVTVRRKGNLHGPTSFTWWTESGTAKPGVDFSPVLPHVEQMQDGQASVVLSIPLLATVHTQPKGFYVGIEEVTGGAQIGARSLTQITLPPTT